MTAYFSIHHIDVHYDKVQALADVSLEIDPGDIVAVVGANGAGKSTMLRAITGLVRPSAGEIHLEGRRVDGLRTDELARLGIAMVPEGRRVYPFMNVRDNLLMGAYQRRDRHGIHSDLQGLYERFPRLRERLKQQASTLSGGEQQMVAIGRALMARPKLLLMDEPSLGLAPQLVREIARSIIAINRDAGVAIILVEQNSRMALKISRYAYVMETGRVALEGPSVELLEDDEVKRLYLGA